MKKLFSIVFIIIAYTQSFAYTILQVQTYPEEQPPAPGITPYSGVDPGVPDFDTPINFIVPFLLITVVCLSIYIIKKNKAKIA